MLMPKLFLALMSAPFSIKSSHRSGFPLKEAKWRAVKPSPESFLLIQSSNYCTVVVWSRAKLMSALVHFVLSLKVHSCSKVFPSGSTISKTDRSLFAFK